MSIFKLCAKDFYTLQYNIYAGKEAVRKTPNSFKIIETLFNFWKMFVY